MRTVTVNGGMAPQPPCAATIGFFDGVHRGHTFLIRQVVDSARAEAIEASVITFNDHPRHVLHSDFQPRMLSTNEEKMLLFSKTGIDRCAVLPFDREMAALSARDFMGGVLRDKLNVRILYIGYDNRFGHDRTEGFDDYVRYGKEYGMEVRRAGTYTLNGVNVSSSYIRSLLTAGEVAMAAQCLGYHYSLKGTVVHGVQQGRMMGFPTANIRPASNEKIVPAQGVYAVKALLQGEATEREAIMNIGVRPTFGSGGAVSMEANIFGFDGDIYGQDIRVAFIQRLRNEHKFTSAQQLARQLADDKARAEHLFGKGRQS